MQIKLVKRAFAIVLLCAMVFTLMPGSFAYAGKANTNLKNIKGHWAKDVLEESIASGILKGDAKGNIDPDKDITRAEFMAIVNRALGLTEKSNKVNHYKDVPKGAWYKDEVAKALAAGYIAGTSENMMSPLNTITNEQVFAIISRLSKEEGEIDLGAVKDGEKISGWAKQGIKKAIAGGYVTGYKGNVQPKKNTTKAQIAVLISRYKKNERVIAFPGTYSFKKAKEITVLSNGVIIKDSEIDGDVKVGKEVAEIVIKNSKIKGKVKTENKDTKVLDKEKAEDVVLKDGEYEGKAVGYSGDIVVKIKIAGGKLVDVKVIKQTETPAYYAMLDGFVDKIIKKGSPEGIDVVSGATVSSNAILNAVRDALSQAKGETEKPGDKIAEGSSPGIINKPQGSKPNENDYGKTTLRDGAYRGKAMGYGGYINVTVDVKFGKIAEVRVDSHRETLSYFNMAKPILEKIVEANGTKVDTIVGATVTCKGILAAVENALEGITKLDKPVADGKWYGQGRGHYSFDVPIIKKGEIVGYVPPTEVSVEIENGKIKDIVLERFGDDEKYIRDGEWSTIKNRIKLDNNTSVARRAMSLQGNEGTEEDKNIDKALYQTVTGATNSARGFLNAVDDALDRAAKFKKDGVNQEIRSIALGKDRFTLINYAETYDLGKLKLKVVKLDGSEEFIDIDDIEKYGIKCNQQKKLTVEPLTPGNYTERRNIDLIFSHEKSGAMHASKIQAARKVELKTVKEIRITLEGGKTKTITAKDNAFSYDVKLDKGDSTKVTKVEVIGQDDKSIKLKEWSVVKNPYPVLVIHLEPLPKAKDSDTVEVINKFNGFNIRMITVFDKDNLSKIRITKSPQKLDYTQGNSLNLSGIRLMLEDKNGGLKEIGLDEFAAHGITANPQNEAVLDNEGKVDVTLSANNLAGEVISTTFQVNVRKKASGASKIKFYDKKTNAEIGEMNLEPGKTVYVNPPLLLPVSYNEKPAENIIAKALNEHNEEIENTTLEIFGHEPDKKECNIKVEWGTGYERPYAMIKISFTKEPTDPVKARFYDKGTNEKIADLDLVKGKKTYFNFELPSKYTDRNFTVAAINVNGNPVPGSKFTINWINVEEKKGVLKLEWGTGYEIPYAIVGLKFVD